MRGACDASGIAFALALCPPIRGCGAAGALQAGSPTPQAGELERTARREVTDRTELACRFSPPRSPQRGITWHPPEALIGFALLLDKTTGAMEALGGPPAVNGTAADPGLVLLYAENWATLPTHWRLPRAAAVVGRDDSAAIHLPVKAVSRRHAEIRYQGGRFSLCDLDSRNGTLIDGHPVREVVLEHAHEIRIGDAILLFVADCAAALGQYRIDGSQVESMALGSPESCPSGLSGGYRASQIRHDVARVAPTTLSVIVRGESGTGKEVVARELHERSGRSGAFAAINCAALPAGLIESELFGYKRGAFSGADRDKPGLIRAAHEGTLFLDEIGDMPLEAQAKLLRVLQAREVCPLGATSPERVDVRVVCATHRNLTELRRSARFREDLYARLNEFQIELLPLRDRKEELFGLARTFLLRHGSPDAVMAFAYMAALIHYDWPHNVRELEACVKRGLVLSGGTTLQEEHLPPEIREAMADYGRAIVPLARPASPHQPSPPRDAPTEEQLRALLELHHGNVAAVGRDLGKARMQIHRYMNRFGIDAEAYRH